MRHTRAVQTSRATSPVFSQTAWLNTGNSNQPTCGRCGGYMAHDMCSDYESDSGYCNFWALRCIQCGEIVDEVILRNRLRSRPKPELVSAA